MGRQATIEATDDGGFYFRYEDQITGRVRTATAKDIGHVIDRIYEVFDAKTFSPDPKAVAARNSVESLMKPAPRAKGKSPRAKG